MGRLLKQKIPLVSYRLQPVFRIWMRFNCNILCRVLYLPKHLCFRIYYLRKRKRKVQPIVVRQRLINIRIRITLTGSWSGGKTAGSGSRFIYFETNADQKHSLQSTNVINKYKNIKIQVIFSINNRIPRQTRPAECLYIFEACPAEISDAEINFFLWHSKKIGSHFLSRKSKFRKYSVEFSLSFSLNCDVDQVG